MNASSNEPQLSRRRVIYFGRVQGIGFRYTTASIARRFPVTGYVRNLPDRTVELVIDGIPDDLEAFQKEISATFSRNIEQINCEELALEGEFSSFGIRY